MKRHELTEDERRAVVWCVSLVEVLLQEGILSEHECDAATLALAGSGSSKPVNP